MSMQIVKLIQGTPEWHAHRAKHFNASDAPAMMGCSSYKSRSDLIKELATGLTPEVDSNTQRRFDDGHRFEALARPLAEEIIGDDLSPCVGVNGKYSASFDGLTFMNDIGSEHKTLNKALRAVMVDGCTGEDLPMQYRVQMEQQAMVSGCERILFMASEWTGDGVLVEERHCWYEPDAELRAQIIAGWEQLEKDVAAYEQIEAAPVKAVGHTRERLPAINIKASGEVTASNLGEFKMQAVGMLHSINMELQSDQDFADAKEDGKYCRDVAATAKNARATVIGNMQSVDEAMAVLEWIEAEFNKKGLAIEKLVKAREEEIKGEITAGGVSALKEHISTLNAGLPQPFMPVIAADFGAAIKNKRTIDSLRNAVNTELARAKIEASRVAEVIRANMASVPAELSHLFADMRTICIKASDDFAGIVAMRKLQAEQAEAQRMDAERLRIRAEEQAIAQQQAQTAEAERLRIQQQAQDDQAEIAQAQQAGKLDAPVAADLASLVADKAVEGVAGIDANQAIAAAQTSAAAVDASLVMTLGQLNTRMEAKGLGRISAATLEFHSIPFTKERSAVQITVVNAKRLMLLISMGCRKLADEPLEQQAEIQ